MRLSRRGAAAGARLLSAAGLAGLLFLCGAAPLLGADLINEDFEGSFPPAGWTISGTPEKKTTHAHSGSYSIYFNASSDILVTPLLTTPGTLTFWYYTTSSNPPTHVEYSFDGSIWNDVSGSPFAGTSSTWVQKNIDLSLYTNIYIRWYKTSSGSLYLDDVVVTSGTSPTPTPVPTQDPTTYGWIDVSSSPATGAEILLDFIFPTGAFTNTRIGPITSGTHHVSIVPSGVVPGPTPLPAPWELTVASGEVALAEFDLSTGTGSITVSSDPVPSGAEIYLDYFDTGQTTAGGGTTLSNVPAGTHHVLIRKDTTDASDCVKPGYYEVLVESGSATSVVSYLELSSATTSATIGVSTGATSGAYIYLDYVDLLGMTPATTTTDIAYGTHSVAVRKTGYLIPPPAVVELSAATSATDINFQLIPGTPWPMFRHDEQHTGESPYAGTSAGQLEWSYVTGGQVYGSPAVGDGDKVYAGSYDNNFYVFNSDGTISWSYPTGAEVKAPPAIDIDGSIYWGSFDNRLYSFASDGTFYWSYRTADSLKSAPAIGPYGTVYVGSFDCNIYALGADGSLFWSYDTNGSLTGSPAVGMAANVYIGSKSDRLFNLDSAGGLIWSYAVPAGIGSNLSSSPLATATGTVYVGTGDGDLYAIDSGGNLLWSYPTGAEIVSSPSMTVEGRLLVGSSDTRLYSINYDGTLIWSYVTGDVIYSSPAVDSEGKTYVGSWDDRIYCLQSDGSFLWSYVAASNITSSPAVGTDGTVYVGSYDNALYALGPPAPTSTPTATPTGTVTPTPTQTPTPGPGDVVINEIAWMGTTADSGDEWIELYNTTSSPIDIANWSIYGADTGVTINFSAADGWTTTVVPANGFLLYADNQNVFSSGATVQIWDSTIAMNNTNPGQVILYSAPNGGGTVIDTANQATGNWFAGDSTNKITMERIDPNAAGDVAGNWGDFGGTPFAKDSGNNDINGTPGQQNSIAVPTPTPTGTGPTPTPSPTPTETPIPGVYVSISTGDDTSGDGSKAKPWKTIEHALDEVSGNTTLYVAGGTYNEWELDLKDGVAVKGGYDPATWNRDIDTYVTIVDAAGAGAGQDAFNGADNCTLDGLTIKNAPDKGAVFISNTAPTVTQCTISNCGTGLLINDASTATVTSSSFANCSFDGIYAVDTNITVTGCTFTDSSDGIDTYLDNMPAASMTVTDCSFTDCDQDGIEVNGYTADIVNCSLTNCGNGVYGTNGGFPVVEDSTFESCEDAADLNDSGEVRRSVFYMCGDAVEISDATGRTAIVENNLMIGFPDTSIDYESGVTIYQADAKVINNTIDRKEYGVRIYDTDTAVTAAPVILLQNNTITKTERGGIYVETTLDASNVAFLYNNAYSNLGYGNYGGQATPGDGSIAADPLFTNPLTAAASARYSPEESTPEEKEAMDRQAGREEENDDEEGAPRRARPRTTAHEEKREKSAEAAASYDYHLQLESPLRDRGLTSGAPADDLDKLPRPYPGTNADIGCYEIQKSGGSQIYPLNITLFKTRYAPGETFELKVEFWDTMMDWDGYLVFTGNGGLWSILSNKGVISIKRGLYPVVKNALEKHEYYTKTLTIPVPFGVNGFYKIRGAIIPTGWEPTMGNATGPYGQYDEESFVIGD